MGDDECGSIEYTAVFTHFYQASGRDTYVFLAKVIPSKRCQKATKLTKIKNTSVRVMPCYCSGV